MRMYYMHIVNICRMFRLRNVPVPFLGPPSWKMDYSSHQWSFFRVWQRSELLMHSTMAKRTRLLLLVTPNCWSQKHYAQPPWLVCERITKSWFHIIFEILSPATSATWKHVRERDVCSLQIQYVECSDFVGFPFILHRSSIAPQKN